MKYAVTIDLSNDAFGPDEYAAAVAIAHALKSHANALLAFGTTRSQPILDANGNVVGEGGIATITTTADDVEAVEDSDAVERLHGLLTTGPDLDWLAIVLSALGHYPDGVVVVPDGTFDADDERTLRVARVKAVAVSDVFSDGTRLEVSQ